MDSRIERAIRAAEEEIRRCIGESANIAAYAAVEKYSAFAKRLSNMVDELTSTQRRSEAVSSLNSSPSTPSTPSSPTLKNSRKFSGKSGYPRFEKSRNCLVKVGWSKKDRKEYVHKAPEAVVDALVARVIAVSKENEIFTAEEILPLRTEGTGDVLPDYQAYVCLAWLRRCDLIVQHGREGYSLQDKNLRETVLSLWASSLLPAAERTI